MRDEEDRLPRAPRRCRRARPAMMPASARRWRRNGSSISSTRLAQTSARASWMRCLMPPESWLGACAPGFQADKIQIAQCELVALRSRRHAGNHLWAELDVLLRGDRQGMSESSRWR